MWHSHCSPIMPVLHCLRRNNLIDCLLFQDPLLSAMAQAAFATKRWTRAEYERMAEVGLFRPDERFELLDGEIFAVTPQGSAHAAAIGKTQYALEQVFGSQYWVRVQMPLVLGPDCEPEPDLAVVSGTPSDYVAQHPDAALLVVEISDPTLQFDQQRKLPVYARYGIPESWIVNLVDSKLEVYRQPVSPSDQAAHYRAKESLHRADSVSPVAALKHSVSVGELFP